MPPTRTLRFTDEVTAVLRAMDWQDDGKLGSITRQLDRGLYEQVNRALTALGGKWNRSRGGHVFPTDPRPRVEGLIESGNLTVERDGFFPTPLPVVTKLLSLIEVRGRVLEPSAGLGAIADQLPVAMADVTCIERNAERAAYLKERGYRTFCTDFLTYTPSQPFDTIVMNPPFEQGQDIDHVRHAYECLAPGGQLAAVMSEGAFFRADRKATEFRQWLADNTGYNERLPADAFRASGTGVATRVVALRRPNPTIQPERTSEPMTHPMPGYKPLPCLVSYAEAIGETTQRAEGIAFLTIPERRALIANAVTPRNEALLGLRELRFEEAERLHAEGTPKLAWPPIANACDHVTAADVDPYTVDTAHVAPATTPDDAEPETPDGLLDLSEYTAPAERRGYGAS